MEEALHARSVVEVEQDEGGLIAAATRGSASAFADLYDRYLERVYRYVYYWVGNRSDAEDLTQQVFLNAWRAIGRYKRTDASFGAWLLVVAHNQIISFFRQEKQSSYLEMEPASGAAWCDPEANALAAADKAALRAAILQLKAEYQQVVVMRFIAHLEYYEIAAALGKSEGNVRVIQHRALAKLRQLLDREVR